MAKEQVSKELLINRLKKIEGQVRGIQRMIESDRNCEDILTQLAAIRSAIESIAALVLNNYLSFCFAKKEGEQELVDINSLARAIAIWGRVSVGR